MTVTEASNRELTDALILRLPDMLREVSQLLRDGWPDYADFLAADVKAVTEAATPFVHRLVEMSGPVAAPHPPEQEAAQLVFEQVGRDQLNGGHDLTTLLTAFQLGARVAWRHVAATALDLGLAPDALATLADSVFGFVNQLSFSAINGYVQAQVDDARVRERNREELAQLLLSGRSSRSAVRTAAARVGWPIPTKAAVVLVDPTDEAARQVVDRLDSNCLPVRTDTAYGAIVPDPDAPGARRSLMRQLRRSGAVVGYAVPPERLPRTVEAARVVLDLRREGLVDGDPVFADEHLDTIIVGRDRGLVDALRHQVLAPLDDLSESTRERLTETLASWLRHQGDRHAMAEELSIHPQTVRYRMTQIRELFGDRLDSPRDRARLFLALSWTSS